MKRGLLLSFALLLSACAAVLPAAPSPVDVVAEGLVALPPDAVRPVVVETFASHPTTVDGRGGPLPGGEVTSYRATLTPFADRGTRVRVVRRALPRTSAPSPMEMISGLHERLDGRNVRVEVAAVWTDSLSLADGLCAPDGETLFEPEPTDVLDSPSGESSPQLIGGVDGLASRLEYPETMRLAGVEGRVVLRFTVEPDGSVGCVQAIESPPVRLTEAAGAAVRASSFTPGVRDGQPVRVEFMLPLRFALE